MSTGVRCIASVMVFAWSMVMPAVAGAWPRVQDQASPVLLTDVISSGGDALRQAAGDGDIGMLLDAQNLSLTDAHAVVFAVEDAQAAGRDVIAIVDVDLEDGSAVVAAACQGMVMVGDVSLTGCGESWCGSPSRRASLAAQLAQSGGRDRAIAERLLGGTSALWYSPTLQSATAQGGPGSIALAQQGKPMKLNAAALQAIGWSGQTEADVASAMAAIVAGQVKTQPKVPPRSSGTGSPPPPPGGKTSPPPPAGSKTAPPPPPPGGKTAPPAPPPGALPPAAAEKLAYIQKDLAALKAVILKFNDYFTGKLGVWTEKSKGLREVWKTGEMTKDQPTKKVSSELQKEMQTLAEKINRNIRGLKGESIPQQAQLRALEKDLLPFVASLKTDDPDKYSQSSAKVSSTTIK